MKNISVYQYLYDVMRAFSVCPGLPQSIDEILVIKTVEQMLMTISRNSIDSSFSSLTNSIFIKRCALSDQIISIKKIQALVDIIEPHIKRLDHIGFCYPVANQSKERERIIQIISETKWRLYEMESVDLATWYFIGDRRVWQDTMIELLPVVPPQRLPADFSYWMPHIHIDINTSFSAEEIISIVKEIFGDTRIPLLYTDPERGTHCVRIWLGVISGVNIQLDLSTNVRNLEWVRKNMLHAIL